MRGEKETRGREGLQQKGLGGTEPFSPSDGRSWPHLCKLCAEGRGELLRSAAGIASKQGGARGVA